MSKMDYNRLSVIQNKYQGINERVLCVCSGGVLRSPTAAWVLSNSPYNCNTRSAGTEDYALIKVDEALLQWATGIVCMEDHHEQKLRKLLAEFKLERPILRLNIPDNFAYRDSELIERINKAYQAAYDMKTLTHPISGDF